MLFFRTTQKARQALHAAVDNITVERRFDVGQQIFKIIRAGLPRRVIIGFWLVIRHDESARILPVVEKIPRANAMRVPSL